ncbi:MAG: hypothetical protein GTO14_22715 [Anaerolineales bacterium]|nr:hypothetical protein [Anaerolineales bacterium]
MTERSSSSPLPVLIIIVLAAASLIQLIAPNLLHPGLTLFLIGVVFLILHFINWVREAITLITGWVLAGFGLSFWGLSLETLAPYGATLLLFGLGLAFLAIFITTSPEETIDSKRWPLVPGILLLLVGIVISLEGTIGRERFWSYLVPLIPSIVAIWYLVEWRRGGVGR